MVMPLYCIGQGLSPEKIKSVLELGVKDSLIILGEWNPQKGQTEVHLKYLGIISSPNNQYKIMTYSWLWGLSKRATNKILVYDLENRFLGGYAVNVLCELPLAIEGNTLIISHQNCGNCANTIKVPFKYGLPKKIEATCACGAGDEYFFH